MREFSWIELYVVNVDLAHEMDNKQNPNKNGRPNSYWNELRKLNIILEIIKKKKTKLAHIYTYIGLLLFNSGELVVTMGRYDPLIHEPCPLLCNNHTAVDLFHIRYTTNWLKLWLKGGINIVRIRYIQSYWNVCVPSQFGAVFTVCWVCACLLWWRSVRK